VTHLVSRLSTEHATCIGNNYRTVPVLSAVVQAMMNRHDANNNQNMSLDEFIRMYVRGRKGITHSLHCQYACACVCTEVVGITGQVVKLHTYHFTGANVLVCRCLFLQSCVRTFTAFDSNRTGRISLDFGQVRLAGR
jgi:hypothetical protein